jgi:DNA (cytosine-5)-methyltransferase 1
MTLGSLFSGIGGFELGFERTGRFECRWQVENDPYATRVLEKHWPRVARYGDITDVGGHNLERVDCITAGFPCQDISQAGKQAGIRGTRSGLFFEAIRVFHELQPTAIVLENVANLLRVGIGDVLGSLAEIGFNVEWHCIPAAAVGAPHYRDRIFLFGFNANTYCKGLAFGKRIGQDAEQARASFKRICGERFGRERVWSPEPVLRRVVDGIPDRVDRVRCLGNAVVPQVAEAVAEALLVKMDWIGKQ